MLSESDDDSTGTTTETIEAADEGPPYYEQVEIDGPDAVAVGEDFTLTVSVANTGGREGDFTSTLSFGESVFSIDTTVEIPSVSSGERKSTEITPGPLTRTGSFTARITDYGATHEISVATKELAAGETLSLDAGPAISVPGISFHSSLLYSTSDGDAILAPDDGRVFAQIQLSVENQGSDDLSLYPSSAFSVPGGDEVTDDIQWNVSDSDILVDGSPFGSPTVSPGSSHSGWILREVDRNTAVDGLLVSWTPSSDDSPPEARWQHEGADLPAFEISADTFPSEVEIGTEANASITIENTGSAAGMFRGTLDRRNADAETWEELTRISVDVPVGSSKTWSTTIQEPHVGPSEYRVWPTSVTREIEFVPASRSYGSPYTTAAGAQIQTDITGMNFDGFSSSYTYKDSFGNTTVEADDGNTFAFVEVAVENTGSETVEPPSRSAFSASVSGSEISPEESQAFGTMELVGPVTGTEYDPGYTLSSGNSASGWLIFEVPEGSSKSDVTVHCSTDQITVEWSEPN